MAFVQIKDVSSEQKGVPSSERAVETLIPFLISDIFFSPKRLEQWECELSVGKPYVCCFFLCKFYVSVYSVVE